MTEPTLDPSSFGRGDHDPHLPFGCPHQFGPELGFGPLPDMRVHTCDLDDERHAGPHRCACGQEAPNA